MLAPKSDFIDLEGVVHLATGGQPPLLKAHRAAFEQFARDKARGFDGYWAHWTVGDEACAQLGAMMGLPAEDFAFVGSASEAIGRVISAIPWRAGDNVVSGALEYASGRYAFARLRALGVEVRLVPPDGWRVSEDRLVEACDARTRLVYVSQVSYLTGQHLDMARLSAGLRSKAVPLLNDASHALGVVPVDGTLCDFTVSAGYKWLLATHMGILAWNRATFPAFEPLAVGWNSANPGDAPGAYVLKEGGARAEVGNRNHLDVYLLRTSLAYLDAIGHERIAAHARALGGELREALDALDLAVTTPAEPDARAGNICFAHPAADRLMALAAADKILIWADTGRVRISVHLHTDASDVEALLGRLPGYLEKCA